MEKQQQTTSALIDKKATAFELGGISGRSVDNLIARGLLKPVKIFRRTLFKRSDVLALAKRGTK